MAIDDWTSTADDVRRVATARGRARLGQFAVEGLKLVERAVRAGSAPKRVLVSERLLRQKETSVGSVLAAVEREGGRVFAVPEAVLLELADGRNSGLLCGLCDLPEDPPIDTLIERALELRAPILVLVDVEEPGNVGALVRTALAAGAAGLIATGVSDPFHPKAVRTSMGSLFKLPIGREPDPDVVMERLARVQRIAAVSQGGVAPWHVSLGGATALLLGKESEGLPERLLEQLPLRVSIPMPGDVDSFSVNAAAAALLYEALRQRAG